MNCGERSGVSELADAAGTVDVRLDTGRRTRCGFPEVIFAQGKTPQQVARIAEELYAREKVVLATRANAEQFAAVRERLPQAQWHEAARIIALWRDPAAVAPTLAASASTPTSVAPTLAASASTSTPVAPAGVGHLLVASAGTADMPVAEEAALTAEMSGARVTRLFDVGIAGVHRLLEQTELLRSARVIIAVAGMEGALPTLVAGLVEVPVIAVPTSVGYGANFSGLAPLLTMLNSCAAGVAVVNIDNGFGAAQIAVRINAPGWQSSDPDPD
jgi:NCAIR mutase (PurE)-related protein